MIDWSAERLASAAGARLLRGPRAAQGPRGVVIDSREAKPGDLFIGLRGERTDGGAHAREALGELAWGALVTPEHGEALARSDEPRGAVLAHPEPLAALQGLARAWREELVACGARIVAITGSTGKTSTKDILAGVLAPHLRVFASHANLNTEIGLPLTILAAPRGTEALVLELAMRGRGQIAELTEIARPDVGLVVNIGPVHLGLLGSLEAIAAAKAELIAGLRSGATAVVPVDEPLLEPHLRADVRTVTFGPGGDFELAGRSLEDNVLITDRPGNRALVLRPSFRQVHNLRNLLAAVAAAAALEVSPDGSVEVTFSALRGERVKLPGEIELINDCYNANPMSVRAAINDLAASAPGRRVAVLGDMLELGPDELTLHRELGGLASEAGVALLVTVGPLARAIGEGFTGEVHNVADAEEAAALLPGLIKAGDTVLVKGSRGVGLERVAQALEHEAATAEAS